MTREDGEIIELGSIINTLKGFAFKSKRFGDYLVPIVKVSNFTDNSISKDNLCFVENEVANQYQKYLLKSNDILIQTVGSRPSNINSVVGKVVLVPSSLKGALLNQNIVKIIPNDVVNNQYLYYQLKSKSFFDYIISGAQGSASQASITLDHIRGYEFYLPPLAEQQRIASILSAYDDLIANNTRRIALLEQMAQDLYREWFVHFRFPGYQDIEMIDSETEFGMIPQGWEVKKIGEVYKKMESGSRPKGGIDQTLTNGIPSVGAESVLGLGKFNYGKEKYITRDFFDSLNRGIIENKDILIYKDGAYIGKTSMFQDNFPYGICCVNEHVFLLNTGNEKIQNFMFFVLNSEDYFNRMQQLNSNAAQPGINQEKLKSLEIIFPTADLIDIFSDKVDFFLKDIFIFAKQNQSLEKQRDILLRKLIG